MNGITLACLDLTIIVLEDLEAEDGVKIDYIYGNDCYTLEEVAKLYPNEKVLHIVVK